MLKIKIGKYKIIFDFAKKVTKTVIFKQNSSATENLTKNPKR